VQATNRKPAITDWLPLVQAMRAEPEHDFIVIGEAAQVWTFPDIREAARQAVSLPVATLVAVDQLLSVAA